MGHGWVKPRPDGSVAKCGGPAICAECKREAGELKGRQPGGRIEDANQLELPLNPIRHEYIPPNPPMHQYIPPTSRCRCTGSYMCARAFR